MKQLSALLLLAIFISCNNADNNSSTAATKKDSAAVTPAKPAEAPLSKEADSINKANAAAVNADGDHILKASVSKGDSTISLSANMKMDHRIFGYKNPDTLSQKMLLLSIFTSDVKDNPYHLPLGAYYSTADMNGKQIKFAETNGPFVRATVTSADGSAPSVIFFEKKWISFDK